MVLIASAHGRRDCRTWVICVSLCKFMHGVCNSHPCHHVHAAGTAFMCCLCHFCQFHMIAYVCIPTMYCLVGYFEPQCLTHLGSSFCFAQACLGFHQVWYGVPAHASSALEDAMKDALPDLFEAAPDLMYSLVTMVSPTNLQVSSTCPAPYHAWASSYVA